MELLKDRYGVARGLLLANTDVVNVHGLRGLMVRTSKGNSILVCFLPKL